MNNDNAIPEVVGEVGTLSKRGRLLIPAAVRKATPWLKGNEPISLIAELAPDRQLRLHPADRAEPLLQRLRVRVTENHPASYQHLAALADRYRPVTYYPSDTQVHLGETINTHMQLPTSTNQNFYIETFGPHIDVMTLERRDERLERLWDELTLEP
jgi:hypothetical protein